MPFYLFVAMESDESAEIMKWEANIQPPTIDELRKFTKNAFSCKYIKYMYSKFKNVRFILSLGTYLQKL